MELTFFEWLRLNKKIDKYEAMLDISQDYTVDQFYNLSAYNGIEKLKSDYKEDKFRYLKLIKILKRIDENKMCFSR